ncbi:Aldehyde:ferredoxin oxidoreductase [Halalkaliarchaeum sp. AArc-CO]|uniref:aldehyde ferredoxin oxidoreductase family protein n=1 Tax=unclassified Halalkaliarchaeum TaxID=2678344 RepID=UPI00217DB7E3|nr:MULTISPECIES: aldehyde ferredoxin oxidoreductase C-terminal domain-containing protein [unclassified Halalkaliarchaeum]MDR5671998.1 aldehyde ferredoxin oxidoreductase C-terminal domain-containing protein [Halalkaliarchaeum sp. AArc-GB]UWG51503.1 Aldehyde:ferredoxin oxidoreductase [Halalkaliarchaeum sp. AArc-CO]
MLHAKGPLLTVDVSERTATATEIDDLLETHVGGRAVATALAHERIPFDADPFGPENRVYLATGPLQVSQTSFTGRMSMTGLSPLSDGLASTNAGGFLSRNFADTGYSVFEVTGKSDELLAIHVRDPDGDGDPRVTFEPVPELEGATVSATSDYMEEHHDLGPEHCIAIGPAGENLVRFASVMTFDSRAFGRGGLGAVLGSKNVKCVTFAGESRPEIEIPDPPESEIHREAATSDDRMKRQGTTGGTEFINENFSLPTRYFEEYHFEDAAGIGGDAVEEKKYRTGTCSSCAYACKLPTRDEAEGIETEGPEFETVYAFGSSQGVGDIVDVMKANELCDELGMDTISAGVTVAAYLKSEDAFGDAELAREVTEQIARREGIGDLLAEGVARAHGELGVDNYTVKGMEFAAHDGRVLHGQGLSYAVANRGADHMYGGMLGPEYNGEIDPEGTLGKSELLARKENRNAVRDSAIICAFSSDYITDDRLATLLGTEYEELLAVGARTVERERHFNNKRGMDREDDRLPYDIPDLEAAIDEYYEERGWSSDGTVPDDAIEASDVPPVRSD